MFLQFSSHLCRSFLFYYLIFRVNFAPGTSAVLSIQWLSMYERGLGGREVTEWELPFNGLPLNQTYWFPIHTYSSADLTRKNKKVHIHACTHTFSNSDSSRQILLMLSVCRYKNLCTLTPTHADTCAHLHLVFAIHFFFVIYAFSVNSQHTKWHRSGSNIRSLQHICP